MTKLSKTMKEYFLEHIEALDENEQITIRQLLEHLICIDDDADAKRKIKDIGDLMCKWNGVYEEKNNVQEK